MISTMIGTEPAVQKLTRLRAAKDLLDREFGTPLDLRQVAAHAGYSPYHFLRAFRAAYGDTPGRYLAHRRIERARDLLGSANLTIGEIALLVGFTSASTFSTRFRAEVGVAPSAYRDRLAARGGPPPVPGCFVLMWSARPQSRRSDAERSHLGSAASP